MFSLQVSPVFSDIYMFFCLNCGAVKIKFPLNIRYIYQTKKLQKMN